MDASDFFVAKAKAAAQIVKYLDMAFQIDVRLGYIGKLWKNPNRCDQVLFSLLDHHFDRKTTIETFNKIRDVALSEGVVSKLTNLQDGLLMFRLFHIKAFLDNDAPFDGNPADDDEVEWEMDLLTQALMSLNVKAAPAGIDEPDFTHRSTDV